MEKSNLTILQKTLGANAKKGRVMTNGNDDWWDYNGTGSLRWLGWCFSDDGGQQDDARMKIGDGLKDFGAMKLIFDVSSVS